MMKRNRLYQLLAVLIILLGILALIPAGITRANSDLQTIPTRGPTPTPTITNTPNTSHTSVPGPSATPQPGTTQVVPTATNVATSALSTAISTAAGTQPVQATLTLPAAGATSTAPIIATGAALTATIGATPTTVPANLATQPTGAQPQTQTSIDPTGIIVTLVAVALVIGLIFWRRPKQK